MVSRDSPDLEHARGAARQEQQGRSEYPGVSIAFRLGAYAGDSRDLHDERHARHRTRFLDSAHRALNLELS